LKDVTTGNALLIGSKSGREIVLGDIKVTAINQKKITRAECLEGKGRSVIIHLLQLTQKKKKDRAGATANEDRTLQKKRFKPALATSRPFEDAAQKRDSEGGWNQGRPKRGSLIQSFTCRGSLKPDAHKRRERLAGTFHSDFLKGKKSVRRDLNSRNETGEGLAFRHWGMTRRQLAEALKGHKKKKKWGP